LPESEEGFDESETRGCEAEGGNESDDAESTAACTAGENWSCFANPPTTADRQEAVVRILNNLIVMGA
jgi:hypothetical protein